MHSHFATTLSLLIAQNHPKLTEHTLFHPSLLTTESLQHLDNEIQSNPTQQNLKNLQAFLHQFKTDILQGFQPQAANEFAAVIHAVKQAQADYQQHTTYEALQNAVAYWTQLLICLDEYPVSDNTLSTILNDSLQAFMDYYWATGEISALEYAQANIERLQQTPFAQPPDPATLVNNLAVIFAEYYGFHNDAGYLEKLLEYYRQTLALTPKDSDDYAMSLSNYGMALQEYFECTNDVQVLEQSIECSQQAVDMTDAALPQYATRLGSFRP